MAVHLNARLKTRFIPILFTFAFLFMIVSAVVHANETPADLELPPAVRQEHQDLRDEADRRPGFSPVTYASEPREGARAAIAAQLNPQNGEEPAPGASSSQEFSDRIQAQPAEADQR